MYSGESCEETKEQSSTQQGWEGVFSGEISALDDAVFF
jgi:hypothetical protein